MTNIIKIWLKFLAASLQSFLEYRIDFMIGVVFMALSNTVPIMFFWIIYGFTNQINGWTFNEVLFLLGLNYVVIGIWHSFFAGIAPWHTERIVINGEMDRALIQPIGTLTYLVMKRAIDNDGLGDLFAGIIVLLYSSSLIGITWSIPLVLLLMAFLFGGSLIFISAMIVSSAIGLVSVRSSVLGDVIFNLERFIEYPLDIFNPAIVFIFTFIIPFGFINYYPAQAFLGHGIWMQAAYFTPVVGVITFAVAYLIWRAGLRHYSSTGS